MFPFGCVFCLSRLAGRNINSSKDSIKKMFRYFRFPEWKNSGGKVCYVWNKITANGFQHKTRLLYKTQQCTRVTYRENDVDNIYFSSSCRKWSNSWTICLLHWCIDGLLWGRNGIEGWNIEGNLLTSWLTVDLLVGKHINGNQSCLFAVKSKQSITN